MIGPEEWWSLLEERELGCPACGHAWYADGRDQYGVWFPGQRGRSVLSLLRRGGGGVICDECGSEAPAMPTVYWDADEEGEEYTLCQGCYGDVADEVWIVPGQQSLWGRCNRCKDWYSLREMATYAGGGPHDGFQGICRGCGEAS